jgi:hypothetical protein
MSNLLVHPKERSIDSAPTLCYLGVYGVPKGKVKVCYLVGVYGNRYNNAYIRSWTGSGSQSDPSVPKPIKYGNSSMTSVSIIRLCCCGWLVGGLVDWVLSPEKK